MMTMGRAMVVDKQSDTWKVVTKWAEAEKIAAMAILRMPMQEQRARDDAAARLDIIDKLLKLADPAPLRSSQRLEGTSEALR